MQSPACKLAAIFCFCAVNVTWAEESEVLRKDLLGKIPPEVVSEKDHWMGKCPPVALAELKGRVVWLQFNF